VEWISDEFCRTRRHATEEPLRDLPVARTQRCCGACTRCSARVVVDDFNVGGQAGAGVGSFDQVMTEQGVAWEALFQHGVQVATRRYFAGEAASE